MFLYILFCGSCFVVLLIPLRYRDTFTNANNVTSSSVNTQAGQLLIPENLRLFPLYVLALAKSPLFRPAYHQYNYNIIVRLLLSVFLLLKPSDVRPDERVYHHHRFKTLSVESSLGFIYPSLFNVSTLSFPNDPSVPAPLPPVLNLSSEKLDRKSLFLLDNTLTLTLYVPKQVAPQVLYEVFGVDQFASLEPGPTHPPALNTEPSRNLRTLVSSFICLLVCFHSSVSYDLG